MTNRFLPCSLEKLRCCDSAESFWQLKHWLSFCICFVSLKIVYLLFQVFLLSSVPKKIVSRLRYVLSYITSTFLKEKLWELFHICHLLDRHTGKCYIVSNNWSVLSRCVVFLDKAVTCLSGSLHWVPLIVKATDNLSSVVCIKLAPPPWEWKYLFQGFSCDTNQCQTLSLMSLLVDTWD